MVSPITLPMPHVVIALEKRLAHYPKENRRTIIRFLVSHAFYRSLVAHPLTQADLHCMYQSVYQALLESPEANPINVHQFSVGFTQTYARLIPEFRHLVLCSRRLASALIAPQSRVPCRIKILHQDERSLVVQEESLPCLPHYPKSEPQRIA